MSDGGQVRRTRPSEEEEAGDQVEAAAEPTTAELLDDVDELLDEIDDVLEANAEEFIRGYVQKGGE